jgi:uncharacterized protein with GYD domain
MKYTYVSLLSFTDQGIRGIKQSAQRATAVRQQFEAAGIKVVAQLWTVGACDGVLVLEGESEQKILGMLAQLAASGNVRTQSLRAFDAAQFAEITAQ